MHQLLLIQWGNSFEFLSWNFRLRILKKFYSSPPFFGRGMKPSRCSIGGFSSLKRILKAKPGSCPLVFSFVGRCFNIPCACFATSFLSQPHFEGSVRLPLTLPKMGLGSPLGLPDIQNLITRVKTHHFEMLFVPLERSQSVNV